MIGASQLVDSWTCIFAGFVHVSFSHWYSGVGDIYLYIVQKVNSHASGLINQHMLACIGSLIHLLGLNLMNGVKF